MKDEEGDKGQRKERQKGKERKGPRGNSREADTSWKAVGCLLPSCLRSTSWRDEEPRQHDVFSPAPSPRP